MSAIDRYVWDYALELERLQGDGAAEFVERQAEEAEQDGDKDEAKVWRAILDRIEALQGGDSWTTQ
jgi:hypothetical protein